jgi:hypothetical protein
VGVLQYIYTTCRHSFEIDSPSPLGTFMDIVSKAIIFLCTNEPKRYLVSYVYTLDHLNVILYSTTPV